MINLDDMKESDIKKDQDMNINNAILYLYDIILLCKTSLLTYIVRMMLVATVAWLQIDV